MAKAGPLIHREDIFGAADKIATEESPFAVTTRRVRAALSNLGSLRDIHKWTAEWRREFTASIVRFSADDMAVLSARARRAKLSPATYLHRLLSTQPIAVTAPDPAPSGSHGQPAPMEAQAPMPLTPVAVPASAAGAASATDHFRTGPPERLRFDAPAEGANESDSVSQVGVAPRSTIARLRIKLRDQGGSE
jgi:hypothetical protein